MDVENLENNLDCNIGDINHQNIMQSLTHLFSYLQCGKNNEAIVNLIDMLLNCRDSEDYSELVLQAIKLN
jgi:hypothetical protein